MCRKQVRLALQPLRNVDSTSFYPLFSRLPRDSSIPVFTQIANKKLCFTNSPTLSVQFKANTKKMILICVYQTGTNEYMQIPELDNPIVSPVTYRRSIFKIQFGIIPFPFFFDRHNKYFIYN